MSKTHDEHQETGYLEDQREFFDALVTNDWDSYADNASWNVSRELEIRQILARIPRPETILDVGCGCGYHAFQFAKHPGVKTVAAVDYSAKSIHCSSEYYGHEKITSHVVDILHSDGPLVPQTFDLVVSLEVIEHIRDDRLFLERCARFARPGGHVAIITPNLRRLSNRIRSAVGKVPLFMDPLHCKEYTLSQLTHLGIATNLRRISHFGHSCDLRFRGRTLMDGNTAVGRTIGRAFPAIADKIGVVFCKVATVG